MTVLIAFATVEGQTAKIANFINDITTAAGYTANLINTDELTGQVSLDGMDQVILLAPVHQRRHPKSFEAFVSSHKEALAAVKSLVLSVSLKAAFASGQEEARDYLTEMLLRTNLKPDASALVAGAVRPESYDYFDKEIIQHVVLLGQKVNPKDGTQEFTDWDALQSTVMGFLDGSDVTNTDLSQISR
ncbi:flavodoxin domain-containing protein [Ruegeria atlantica]|uniref:flavodoxin domain-containing protein n=1 Tax=Ruegeria atlantica TaxID=81569 RepID=UPI00147DC25F|nr:flavodoxin domain-containing protein [Ruegeria atlantica]